MKCLNEFFIDCFQFLIVYIWSNGRVDRRSCTIQRRRTSELIEGSAPWCYVKRSQGSTEWIQPRSQPRDIRRVEYVRYKRPTLDEGRVSFTWVELTNEKNMKSMFWEHSVFQWIDIRVTLLRSTKDIIKCLIPPEDRDSVGICTFQLQQLSSFGWGNSNLLNGWTQLSTGISIVPFKRLNSC